MSGKKTPAQERYISAIKRGLSKEEAEWTRDNPPGVCRQHPDRPAWSPSRRDCDECREQKRKAAQAKERAKTVTSTCRKCAKQFTSRKYSYRSHCPDCHASAGQAKPKPKPKPVPRSVTQPKLPVKRAPMITPKPVVAEMVDTPSERQRVEALLEKARRERVTLELSRWS